MAIEISTKKAFYWKNIGAWVSAAPDEEAGGTQFFNDGRIIPIFYFFPEFHFAYIIKSGGEKKIILPFVRGNGKILLRARSSKTKKLENTIYAFRSMNINMDKLNDSDILRLEASLNDKHYDAKKVAYFIGYTKMNTREKEI
jgi:hypothetical protein